MKQLTGIIILALAIFSFQLGAAAEPSKIGIIDIQKCIQQSNEGKRITESLKKKQTEMQDELKKKDQELLDMQKDMEKQSLMLSEEAKEERLKEFNKMRKDRTYLIEDMNEDMKKAQLEAQNQIMRIVLNVIDTIAQNKKIDLVTERNTALYYSKDLDITDDVIAELNKIKP